MLHSTISFGLLAFALGANAYSNYAASCSSWSIAVSNNTPWLGGYCYTNSGSLVITGLDLNECFVNNSGLLGFGKYGNFYNSCRNLEWSQGSTIFYVTCDNGRGQSFRNQINTNDWVGNVNGKFTC